MSGECEYCGDERGENEYVAIVSHGFGRENKEWIPFCSVECRVWWRRRESDNPGEWEQPAPKGYRGRLDRFVTDDHDDRSESATAVAARPTTESESAQEATA